jgi:hypothetical protein
MNDSFLHFLSLYELLNLRSVPHLISVPSLILGSGLEHEYGILLILLFLLMLIHR